MRRLIAAALLALSLAGGANHAWAQAATSVSQVDKSAFAEGASRSNPISGAVNDTRGGNCAEDTGCTLRATNKGDLHVVPYDSTGVVFGSVSNPIRVDPTGTTTQPVSISGTPAVTISGTPTVDTELPAAVALSDALGNPTVPGVGAYCIFFDGGGGQWKRCQGTVANGLLVDVSRVGGTVTVGDGSGPLTVDGTVTANQGGAPWSVSGSGNFTVVNGGTFAVQDSQVLTDNGAFTDGTSKLFPSGFIFDEVAGTALTENDAAAARIDSKRAQVLVLEDATTRGQRATVSAAGALKTDGSAVTQPVSGTVTANIGTSGSLALDASVTGLQVSQASTTSGQKGGLTQGAVTTAAPSYTTAQTSPLSLTTSGLLRVDGSGVTQPVSGTITANAGTNLNTSALALDTSVNGVLLSQGSTTSGQKGPLGQGAVTTSSPTYTTGQTSPLSLDTAGGLRVSIIAGGGSGGTASTYGAAFPATGTAIGVKNGANMVNLAADGSSNLLVNCAVGCAAAAANDATGALGALNNAVTLDNVGGGAVSVQILTGTLVGTVTPEASNDNSNWVAVNFIKSDNTVSATTATFPFFGHIDAAGWRYYRVRVSAFTSGTSNGFLHTTPILTQVTQLPAALVGGRLDANVGSIAGTAASVNNGTTDAGTQRVTLSSDSTGQVKLATGANTIGALTANQSVNLAQVAGGSTAVGHGTAATALRVELPTDGTGAVTANIGTTNGLALDASLTGLQVGQGSTTSGQKGGLTLGAVTTAAPSYTTAQSSPLSLTTGGLLRTDGSAVTQPVSIAATVTVDTELPPAETPADAMTNANNTPRVMAQGMVYNGTTWDRQRGTTAGAQMQGAAATGASKSGNPVQGGAVFNTTQPTVTTGQVVEAQATARGGLIIASGVDAIAVNNTQQGTASQNVAQFGGTNISTGTGAGGAGIPRVTISNDSSLAANQSVNVNQLAGTATSVNNGAVDAGTLRVTIANNSTGTVVATQATAANLKVEAVGTKTNNNAAPGATNVGVLPALANASAPSWTEGNQVAISTDLSGNTRVNCVTGCSGGPADQSAFVAGTTTGTIEQDVVDDTPGALSVVAEDKSGATRMTANRAEHVDLRDSAGQELGATLPGQRPAPLQVTVAPTFNQVAGLIRNAPIIAAPAGAILPANGQPSADKAAQVVAQSVNPSLQCPFNAPFSVTANTRLVANPGGKAVHVCAFVVVVGGAENVSLVEGTGATCGTGTAGMIGGAAASLALAANGGFSLPGDRIQVPMQKTGDDVCILKSAANNASGFLTYGLF